MIFFLFESSHKVCQYIVCQSTPCPSTFWLFINESLGLHQEGDQDDGKPVALVGLDKYGYATTVTGRLKVVPGEDLV